MDETWAPYVQSRVVVPEYSVAGLDPRKSPPPRIQITVTQRWHGPDTKTAADLTALYSSGTAATLTTAWSSGTAAARTTAYVDTWNPGETRRPLSNVYDLGIRSLTRTEAGNVEIEADSDEALLQDWHPGPADSWTATGLRQVAAVVVGTVIPGAVFVEQSVDQSTKDTGLDPFSPSTPEPSGWDYLSDFLSTAGARLWSDGSRAWHLTKAIVNLPEAQRLTLPASVIESANLAQSRDDWGDAAFVIWKWTVAGAPNSNWIGTYSPNYSKAVVDVRDMGDKSASFFPGSSTAAASALYERITTRGLSLDITALSDWHTTPGQPFTATLTDGSAHSGYVSAVAFNFEDNTMQLTTRNVT
jgi:hypothetical protein